MVAIAVRLNKLPSEVLAMPVDEYELLLGHFLNEKREAERQAAKDRAAQAVRRKR